MEAYRSRNKILIVFILLILFLAAGVKPVSAQLPLTQEEKDYIETGKTIRAASIYGAAPLHYLNSKGEITGIAVSILDSIADMTGLIFEYELYASIDDVFESNSDIIFGLTTNYAPADMVLSQAYLKSETILFINASLDSSNLEDKTYASIKGGNIPDGILEENTIYYNSREETLNAVENGEVDYGYGNEYSIAFYTLQNGYKNIITIPKAKESREYAIGFPKEDEMLLSIMNKAIDAIDDRQMNQLILEVASRVERKITFSMVMDLYGKMIFGIFFIAISILLWGIISNLRAKESLSIQNRRYELLSQISNEYLFEYHVKDDYLKLSERYLDIFGTEQNLSQVMDTLKNLVLGKDPDENMEIINLSLANGEIGVFKIVKSNIYDDWGEMHYIIGKLINISKEAAERERLIIKTQTDGLTGIYNNITTKKLIDENIRNRAGKGKDALILIDCDEFKNINDNFGHLAGDQALKNLSKALTSNFRQRDIIGRIGGDEFCIYMKDIPSVDSVRLKCDGLITLVQGMDTDFNLIISIGIAILKDEKTHDELFKKADHALYESKRTGGAIVYSAKLD